MIGVTPRDAIILAAGMGTRLRPFLDGVPKGLLEIEGETLVGLSTRQLRDAGIERLTIVAGYGAGHYRQFAATREDVRLVLNDQYETTGSMASLAVALERIRGDVLVLESDIVYEQRALEAILNSPASDATLISGPTGAGDEVWVYAPNGRVRSMSKNARELPMVHGEFVGITRLSRPAATAMLDEFGRFTKLHDHARMDYETGALVAVSRQISMAAVLVPDLCWGEIDDERQLERVVRCVWPKCRVRRSP